MRKTVGDTILDHLSMETPYLQVNLIADLDINRKSSRKILQILDHNNYITRQKYGQTYLVLLTEKGKQHVEYVNYRVRSSSTRPKPLKLEPIRSISPTWIHEKAVTKLCPSCNRKIPISRSVGYTVCPRCLSRIKVIKAISDQTHRHGIILRAEA